MTNELMNTTSREALRYRHYDVAKMREHCGMVAGKIAGRRVVAMMGDCPDLSRLTLQGMVADHAE